MDEGSKIKNLMTKHDIASSKQKFESDDSEGSDLSYESSVTDEEDTNVARLDFFKEEMARFFINYPELINKDLLKNDHDDDNTSEDQNTNDQFNRNWQAIADEIFNEAKDPSTSLEALAKRISLYRYKLDQQDIIDLLLQEKNTILKEIEIEMAHKKSQKNMIGHNEKHVSHDDKQTKEDNMYYSWRKRKEFQFKMNGNKNKHLRSQSSGLNKVVDSSGSKSVARGPRSLHKAASVNQLVVRTEAPKKQSIRLNKPITPDISKASTKRTQPLGTKQKEQSKHLDESDVINQTGERLTAHWRHLANFEPQTEIGKQLSEDIKKKNSPNDELGIKKTIIEFLVNYKELINNEVINKVTLSQKIQKIYTEDAKELMMFYPSKIGGYEPNSSTSCNTFKDNIVDDKFVDLLKNIAEGPLIKYWRELQESKI